jgi:1,2-diacylglycerol 3-beta-galactosyltransferase
MTDPKRILILTADAGFGHRSAANAIAAALEEKCEGNCQIDIVNPLEDKRAPFFLRDVGSDYDKIIRHVPELYRFSYDASDSTVPAVLIESAMVVVLYEIIRDMVKLYRPDAILTTYPLYQAPMAAVFSISRFYIPFITVVTDLVTVHRIWFNKGVDACLVPTQMVADLAVMNGLPPEKVHVTGLPVHPNIARETRDPAILRAELGWRPDLTTILAVGSRRVEGMLGALNVVNHFGAPLQLSVVAGKDEKLYQGLVNMDWHLPSVHLYEYSSTIPLMMRASDAVICKAGGLIVTESLACGRPMILVDVIPGQETGNAEYVLQNGAGDLAENSLQVLEVLAHWMAEDQKLLHVRAQNAAALGKPNAAYEVSDILWAAAQHGPVKKHGRQIAGRPTLVQLLAKNHVRWQEPLASPDKTIRNGKQNNS